MIIRARRSLLYWPSLRASLAACSLMFSGAVFAGSQGQAKVTKEQAEKVALARVPAGTIKSAELETEHGKLIWSFDISRPKTANITEIQVDAKKGTIVSEETETPSEQAEESQADKKSGS